jgi:hypothetical protein
MKDLIEAYKETDFNIYEPRITINVGKLNQELDQLLKTHNCIDWAYITAWNPYSEITDVKLNEQNNNQLRNDLIGYTVFDGEGIGSDPSWKPEKSFLILGIALDDAILIGKKYRQNAIIAGKVNEVPQLIWTRD